MLRRAGLWLAVGLLAGCDDDPGRARGADGAVADAPAEPGSFDARHDGPFVADLGGPGPGQWPTAAVSAPWLVTRVPAVPAGPPDDAGADATEAAPDAAEVPRAPFEVGAHAEGDSFALASDGNGLPITGAHDDFLFVHRPLTGDGAIVALARSTAGCGPARIEVGVMVRSSTADDASYAMAAVTGAAAGVTMMSRASSGWYSNVLRFDATPPLPVWLKVERNGNRLRVGYSRDGRAWTQAERDLFDAPLELQAGLVAASHGGTCAVLFERVALLGAGAQAP
jgi:hypothetical protein